MKGLTPAQKLTITMFQGTVNTLIINPQKVTGTLQQYTTGQIRHFMLSFFLMPGSRTLIDFSERKIRSTTWLSIN